MRLAILSRNPSLYSSRALVEAAKKRGHQVKVLDTLQFDIAGYVGARLARAGIGTVTMLDEDTYSQPERFFSYRRACHAGEPGYGRQISLIGVQG